MHRDVISHVVVAPHTDVLATASADGHVKFWKKMKCGVEFVKHYHARASGAPRVEIHAAVSCGGGRSHSLVDAGAARRRTLDP